MEVLLPAEKQGPPSGPRRQLCGQLRASKEYRALQSGRDPGRRKVLPAPGHSSSWKGIAEKSLQSEESAISLSLGAQGAKLNPGLGGHCSHRSCPGSKRQESLRRLNTASLPPEEPGVLAIPALMLLQISLNMHEKLGVDLSVAPTSDPPSPKAWLCGRAAGGRMIGGKVVI